MKDEEKLMKWKQEIEKQALPDERLERAIQIGFDRANAKRVTKRGRRLKRSISSIIIAAVLLLAFITSIRVSPAFANALASIPGMSGIVEMIQDNKGYQLAIENEHYQKIDASGEVEGLKVTLEGIITDETSLVAFSTIEKDKKSNLYLSGYRIIDRNGEVIPNDESFNTSWFDTGEVRSTSAVEINFEGAVPTKEMILEYEFKNEIGSNQVKETIQIPFKVELDPVKKEVYAVNQTVTVEDQKIHIRSITVGPIKTAVEVEFDAGNTKEIFGFEDLRIVDEKGDVWTAINNGVVANWKEEEPHIIKYYLQSNYFKETDHLYLKFNKLMALDKDEAELVVNTETQEIIKQPKDARFSNFKIHGAFMAIELKGEKSYHHNPFSTFYDADGKKLSSMSGSFSKSSDESTARIGLDLPNKEFKNPIRFPLNAYPTYIKGNVEIKIK